MVSVLTEVEGTLALATAPVDLALSLRSFTGGGGSEGSLGGVLLWLSFLPVMSEAASEVLSEDAIWY